MIDKDLLNIEWINTVSVNHGNADPILVEKVIRAFLLLEGLQESGINFVFKGGTALMLHFENAHRLSIDIDIVTQEEIDFHSVFHTFLINRHFTRFEENIRTSTSSINKSHYKLFYMPTYTGGGAEGQILLDIVYAPQLYTNLENLTIQSSFIPSTGESLRVRVPSKEDLLGDKLTAFAPNTTGIPYKTPTGIGKEMEIIKQLYDIGKLFDSIENMATVLSAFSSNAITQLCYSGLGDNPAIVLHDIINTSLILSLRGGEDRKQFESLQEGIIRVKSFIFSESYYLDRAISDASKAAYLSSLILSKITILERFTDVAQVEGLEIKDPITNKLNKLKKVNPEAFFYWCKTSELYIPGPPLTP